MPFDTSTLLLVWFAGGFILFLAWAAIMGQALMGRRRGAVPPTIAALAVVGLLHPAAAVGAFDLARLCRSLDDPDVALPRWSVPATAVAVGVSLVVAATLWIRAGGSP